MNRHNRVWILLLPAILILPCICFSQARKPTQRSAPARTRPLFLQQAKSFEETPYVTKLVLRNGLTVLVEEHKTHPVVSIQTHIHAGSFHEPSQNVGVGRLLASLIERGPADKISGTLRQNAHALGGIIRRRVDYENTHFEIIGPSSQWKQALNLQANALLNVTLDPNDLAFEANRVRNEARDALDKPSEYAKEKLLELAFGQPRMEKNGEVIIHDLNGLKRESLVDFYRAMYTPSRTTLAISGDVSPSDVLNEVARLYGKSPASAGKSISIPARESQSGFRYRVVQGDVPIPHVLFGFHAVPENAEDYRAIEVLAAILGLGEGSVLNSRLRDQMGIIWAEETCLLADQSFGYFLIRMEVDPENIDRSQIAALTEIELLKREELDKADVIRAQAQLELEYWKRRDTVTERAEALAYYEALGDWKRTNRYISEIKKVGPSDIKRVANKYLRLERCSLMEYLPASEAARNTTVEGMLQTLEGLVEGSADQERAKREKEVIPFMKIPEFVDSFRYSEVQYPFQMASILRGPDMFIREDHTAPLIEMGLFFRGGKFSEKTENAGITRLMTQLMIMGTKDMPARQFYRQLEIYGGRVQPVVHDDYFGVMFSILSSNFSAGFNLLQQTIKAPGFDQDDLNRIKEIQKRSILVRRKSRVFAQDLMSQALFRDFPYSRSSLGTELGLSGITPASVVDWHGEHAKNRKPFVVIIGDSKGTSLATHFVKHFSGSRMRDSVMPEEWAKALEKPVTREESWERDQSLILIGFQAPPVDDEDGHIVTVLENLVGNQDQLSQAIRDGLGAAHTLSVVYEPRSRGGSLIAWAATTPDSEEKVLNALKEAMKHIVEGPITYREFRSAVNSAAGTYQIMNQARSEQIQQVVENLLAGKGIDAFLNFPMNVQQTKAEELSEIAQRILNLEKAAIVRVRGQSK
jgi:zinc protease